MEESHSLPEIQYWMYLTTILYPFKELKSSKMVQNSSKILNFPTFVLRELLKEKNFIIRGIEQILVCADSFLEIINQ